MVSDAMGFAGSTEGDASEPDGTPRKLLVISTLQDSGWEAAISLREGIESTVSWGRSNQTTLRV